MLAITTKSEHIGHWIRMRQSLARFSASVSSFHAPSWADFITTTLAFRFSVHTAAGVPTLNQSVSTLRFFFKVTLGRADIVNHTQFIHVPRKLPVVLSPEEVARFLDATPGLKYKVALSVAYGAGLRVSEVVALKVSD